MLKTFTPKSKILSKYIDLFYVFDEDTPKNMSYIAFPHTNTGIFLFKNCHIQLKDNEALIKGVKLKTDSFRALIVGNYTQPKLIRYKGVIQEIAIIFKPLGINHFINSMLGEIAPKGIHGFTERKWVELTEILYSKNTLEEQIRFLEWWLLSHWTELDLSAMHKALLYLENVEEYFSIKYIADALQLNIKTFQRQFFKYLACSPSDYRRIAKFRHSLNNGIVMKDKRKLTDLAYDSNYYDQSYFVREYKKLTSHNPSALFTSITSIDERKIIWKIK